MVYKADPRVSNPINRARETQPVPNRYMNNADLQTMADKMREAYQFAADNKIKNTHPALKGMAELFEGYSQGYKKHDITPQDQLMQRAGYDVPAFDEPQDITEDEAAEWIVHRTGAFSSPRDYAAQLAREYETYENLPTLQKVIAEAIGDFGTTDPDALEQLSAGYQWKQKSEEKAAPKPAQTQASIPGYATPNAVGQRQAGYINSPASLKQDAITAFYKNPMAAGASVYGGTQAGINNNIDRTYEYIDYLKKLLGY